LAQALWSKLCSMRPNQRFLNATDAFIAAFREDTFSQAVLVVSLPYSGKRLELPKLTWNHESLRDTRSLVVSKLLCLLPFGVLPVWNVLCQAVSFANPSAGELDKPPFLESKSGPSFRQCRCASWPLVLRSTDVNCLQGRTRHPKRTRLKR